MAKTTFLTDEQVESEIARLTKTDAVKLARREQRVKYRRRQVLYSLRALEKRGKQLIAQGVTMLDFEIVENAIDAETAVE
ncbi:MAG TPA: hypothetical protein DIT79_00965 [Ruminococcaceae bacterium]|jgi:hypothetical protein|nr:hypothetical protein [Oscillospiraceae bacterium]